jgi:hypothetical protein
MNIVPILVAALGCFIVGFIFHMPPLGRIWMRLNNIQMPTDKQPKLSDMWKQMVLNYLANAICAFVLFGVIKTGALAYGNMGWLTGGVAGVFMWLGFIVTNTSNDVIWMGKNKKAWAYEMVSSLVALFVMGAILGGW